jgi:hypothetical protein
MNGLSHPRYRLAILAFAAALGAAAAWVLVAELARPAGSGRSTDSTCRAAALGRWRGDLWAACAQDGQQAMEAAARAVRLAPHDAGAWLVLARFPPPGGNAVDCLKMSYYTGPNAAELMALRLFISVQPVMLADDDIPQLMRRDIRTIVSHHPELKPAIVAAHRAAAPAGRRLIEAAVTEVDAGLLAALQAGTR